MTLPAPLEITIEGKPLHWVRHSGSGKSAHEPAAQVQYKNTIARAVGFGGAKRLRGYERYWFRGLFFLPPTAAILKADPEGVANESALVTATPDLDNWLKLPLDALSKGLVWRDDCRVYSFDGSRRFYSHRPRLEIMIAPAGRFDQAAIDAWERGK